MSLLQVTPTSFDMTIRETVPLGFDCTNYLVAGDSVSAPIVSELRDLTSDAVIAYVGTPAVNGNVIVVPFAGSILVTQHSYRLTVRFTASAGKILEAQLTINCVP